MIFQGLYSSVYFVCFVIHVIEKGNDMKIGNEVSFTYLKGADAGIVKGVLTKDYASKAEAYAGKVVEIRDIADHPLSNETLRYGNIKGERSQKLVTVELEDGFHKAFYDGRMVGLEVAQPFEDCRSWDIVLMAGFSLPKWQDCQNGRWGPPRAAIEIRSH